MDIEKIIDLDRLEILFEAFQAATGIAVSLASLDGKFRTHAFEQRICDQFHRQHAESAAVCIGNESRIKSDLMGGEEQIIQQCPFGLFNAAAPIVVNRSHVANLFTDKFLFAPPDPETIDEIRRQAVRWGFDEKTYLDALADVPVIPRERVLPILKFLKQFAEMIGEMGYNRLKLEEGSKSIVTARAALKKEIQKRDREAEKLTQILEANSIPTFVIDSVCRITHWNRACERLTGLRSRDMIGSARHWHAFYPEERPLMADILVRGASTHELSQYYGRKYRSSLLIEGGYEGEDFFPKLGKNGKWLFFTAGPIKGAEGEVVGAIETIQDITNLKMMVQALEDREKELEEKSRYLEKVNQALKASLDHREVEKRAVEENMLIHLKRFVFPYIEELGNCTINQDTRAYLNIIETNLNDIVSRFSKTVFWKYLELTPTEVRIADLIRSGKNSKDIAQMLGLSPSSVQWHRKNIREKLGLTNKKANLQTYLTSLAE